MKVSIVIPVYNEQTHLKACLESIKAQTTSPFEVIVVDNNSTDDTVGVAKQFNFVTIISEKRQGVVHARSTGFNVAKGDIIGRIDADTILEKDWILNVKRIFKDKTISAVSGRINYYDCIWPKLSSKLDLFFRRWLASKMKQDEMFLQGANMALRRSAWTEVRRYLCYKSMIHEDFDLALHLQDEGFRVVFDDSLLVSISTRRFKDGPIDIFKYAMLSPLTYKKHYKISRFYMYPIIILILSFYLIIRINARTKENILKDLISRNKYRVNPATFVE